MKKHNKLRTGRHATKKDKIKVLQSAVDEHSDNLVDLRDDIRTIIRTVADLNDRFDAYLVKDEVDAEEQVEGGPLHTYDAEPGYTPTVTVQVSNITGSPYNYLYIYLSPDHESGPHIILSDAREFGSSHQKGIIVGRYEHYEMPASSTATVKTFQEALIEVKDLMDGKEE